MWLLCCVQKVRYEEGKKRERRRWRWMEGDELMKTEVERETA